jgi:hypothetical protein
MEVRLRAPMQAKARDILEDRGAVAVFQQDALEVRSGGAIVIRWAEYIHQLTNQPACAGRQRLAG